MTDLNSCQAAGLKVMESGRNVFLTGAAGTGKSHLVRHYLQKRSRLTFPIVASTGAAALLVGGRTFHSYFGLGLAEGTIPQIVAGAMKKDRVIGALRLAKGILIDEISMIPWPVLDAAEAVARAARNDSRPWGGLQIIAVGDFRQLPPVSKGSNVKQWAFDGKAWEDSDFQAICLRTPMRAVDPEFLEVLNHIRGGVVSPLVERFLNGRALPPGHAFEGTRLFGRRVNVEDYNLNKLAEIDGAERTYATTYWGATAEYEKRIRKDCPLPEKLKLKEGALVMMRRNDSLLRWVNGSLGWVRDMDTTMIKVELTTGELVEVEEVAFEIKDGAGTVIAFATNFPLNLAWATTIHKSQGCTLDKMLVDLTELWEPGHAYVALSRVRGPDGLFVTAWDRSSIKVDNKVTAFHKQVFPKEG